MIGLVSMLVTLLVVALICAAAWYVVGLIPLPGPLAQIIKIIFGLIVLLVLIGLLLGYVPPVPLWYGRHI